MRIVNDISEIYLGIREREERWEKHHFSSVHTVFFSRGGDGCCEQVIAHDVIKIRGT